MKKKCKDCNGEGWLTFFGKYKGDNVVVDIPCQNCNKEAGKDTKIRKIDIKKK